MTQLRILLYLVINIKSKKLNDMKEFNTFINDKDIKIQLGNSLNKMKKLVMHQEIFYSSLDQLRYNYIIK